jgi:hypothetical protein
MHDDREEDRPVVIAEYRSELSDISARVPPTADLDLIVIDPPREWLDEASWAE